MPILFAEQPGNALHSRHLYASHLSPPAFPVSGSRASTQPAQPALVVPAKPALQRTNSDVSITGVVCDCEDSPYDEVGCIVCLEKALAAMEHPEQQPEPSKKVINEAEEIQALQDYANGVFCTCKNSEYDEVGCDTCIERAFKAMAH